MLMIRQELQQLVEHEMDLTAQAAVMIAAGHSWANAGRVLGMTVAEIAIAKERIARMGRQWQSE